MNPTKLELKGSSKIVADYFEFAIHSILFQRGIYPAEDFQTVRKWDLPMLVNVDDDVKGYVDRVMAQIKKWVYGGRILKLVLVIVGRANGELVERWEFDIEAEQSLLTSEAKSVNGATNGASDGTTNSTTANNVTNSNTNNGQVAGSTVSSSNSTPKSKLATQREIQAIIRQITSLVLYLPILSEDDYTFNVLVYTDPANEASHIPVEWCDTDGDKNLMDGEVEKVGFAKFSTEMHRVGTTVSYKLNSST